MRTLCPCGAAASGCPRLPQPPTFSQLGGSSRPAVRQQQCIRWAFKNNRNKIKVPEPFAINISNALAMSLCSPRLRMRPKDAQTMLSLAGAPLMSPCHPLLSLQIVFATVACFNID